MTGKTCPLADAPAHQATPGHASFARRLAEKVLPCPDIGRLHAILPSGESILRGAEGSWPDAAIAFKRWRAFWRLMWESDIGFARSYIDGDWSTSDLPGVIEFGLRNEKKLAASADGWRIAHMFNGVRHALRANTRRGSRRNIHAHYDLGNAFYSLWLDRGMNYSSALYRDATDTLESAQNAKLERAAELLAPQAGHSVLEIGCGWGALAEKLVRSHGCKVTGLTLSTEQMAYARERLAAEVQAGAFDVQLRDYRDIADTFDRIVSIEMIEAVGERYWPAYFQRLRQSLNDEGVAVVQAITIDEPRFDAYRSRPDFIQRFIFPGGMLPTVSIIRREAERAGLTLAGYESFGASYAQTLAEWRRRFLEAWGQIEALGFDDRFRRLWEYYLAYCETGFRTRATDVGMFTLRPARAP